MIKKSTGIELVFTFVLVVALLIIGFSIIPNKPDKFENNHKYKKVDKVIEEIRTIPCNEAESCKG